MSQGRLLSGLLWFAPLVLAFVYCRPARLRLGRVWYDRLAAGCVTIAGVAFLIGTKGLFSKPKTTTWLACLAMVGAVQLFLPTSQDAASRTSDAPPKGPSLFFVSHPDLLWPMLLGNGLITLLLISLFLRNSGVPMGSRLGYALLCTIFLLAPLALLYRGLLWAAGRRAMRWIMALEGLRLFWIGLSLLAFLQTRALLPATPALEWLTHWKSGPRHDLSVTPRLFVGACLFMLFVAFGLQLLYQWLYLGWAPEGEESGGSETPVASPVFPGPAASRGLLSAGAHKFLLWGCVGVMLASGVWVQRLPAKRRAILYQQVPGVAAIHGRVLRLFHRTILPPLGPFLAQRKQRFLAPPPVRPSQVSRSQVRRPDIVLLMVGGMGADALRSDRMPRWTKLLAKGSLAINRRHLGGSGAKGSSYDALSTLHGVHPYRLDLLRGRDAWPLRKLQALGYDVEWMRPKGTKALDGPRFDRVHDLAKGSFHAAFQQIRQRLQRGEAPALRPSPRVVPRRAVQAAPAVRPRLRFLRPPVPTPQRQPTILRLLQKMRAKKRVAAANKNAAPTTRRSVPANQRPAPATNRSAPKQPTTRRLPVAARPRGSVRPVRPELQQAAPQVSRKPLVLVVSLPLRPKAVPRSRKMCGDYKRRLQALDLAMHKFWKGVGPRIRQQRLAFLWTGSHGWMPARRKAKEDVAWMRYGYVPLVMSLPNGRQRSIQRSSHADLLPTILDVAGTRLAGNQALCDGRSLRYATFGSDVQVLSLPLSGTTGVMWTTRKHALYARWGPKAGLDLLRAEARWGGALTGATKGYLGAFSRGMLRMWRPGKSPLWSLQGDSPGVVSSAPGDGICQASRLRPAHGRARPFVAHPLSAKIGDFVRVLGFDLVRKTKGRRDHVTIRVVVEALKPLGKVRLFFHLKGKGYYRNKDRKLFHTYPPKKWKAGDVVSGVYSFTMPQKKSVALTFGLWKRSGRLRATGPDAAGRYVKLLTLLPR